MSPATLRRYRAERLLERDFAALRSAVVATVGARLRASGAALDAAELDACYATAWQGLYAAALAGEQIANPRAWLVLVTYRRAIEELRARRRGEEQLTAEATLERDVDAELDDRDRLRSLIHGMRGRLDLREREAAVLCYLHGYSRGEAARLMGVSDTRMRKLMEGSKGRAGVSAKVGEIVATIRDGGFCESQGSLMRAFAFGVLDPGGERYRLAVMHRRACPACRRYVASLRGAAVVLPPVLSVPGAGATSLLGLAGLGQHVAAGPTGASLSSLGASAATGGGAGAGGGWALGSGIGAKLAAGCLLAVGIGAGCVAVEHGASHAHRHPARASALSAGAHLRRAPAVALAGPVAAPAPLPAGRRLAPSRPAPVRGVPAPSAAAEFSPERQPSRPRAAAARIVTAGGSLHEPTASAVPPASSSRAADAAVREFSPG